MVHHLQHHLPCEGDAFGRPVGDGARLSIRPPARGAALYAHGGRAGGAGHDGELSDDNVVGASCRSQVWGHPKDGTVRSNERGGLGPGGKVEADGGEVDVSGAVSVANGDPRVPLLCVAEGGVVRDAPEPGCRIIATNIGAEWRGAVVHSRDGQRRGGDAIQYM